MRAVRASARFTADVAEQIATLAAAQEWSWLGILEQDLDETAQLLTRFPDAGRELTRAGSVSLRKLRLRRAPFYVWYRTGEGEQTRLVRLFHVRQRTPRPRPR